MDLGLKGKVAFIAGGSQGLGKASAMQMSREGARLAICALDDPELPSGRVIALTTDVEHAFVAGPPCL